MTAERWAQVEDLFQRAIDCPPAERLRLMDEVGSTDPELRGEVESLLFHQQSAREHLVRAVHAAGFPDRAEFEGTQRFLIQRRLGEGGYGVVYEVYDRWQEAVVALKVLPEAKGTALYSFKREFRGLANTVHRNLVRLYELLSENQQWFFTMELVDGADFFRHVWNGEAQRVDTDRLRAALRQLVEGVCALHQAGKLHRDLKPSNVLVTKEGRVVILDFGLATEIAVNAPGDSELILGTPAYMSPEQATGKTLSEASDWYSVGVMLYQALTGGLPFDPKTRTMLALKQEADVPPPSLLMAGIPEDLNGLCRALLRRDPGQRPSGREMLRRLGGADGSGAANTNTELPIAGKRLFIGRQKELAELRRAFEVVQQNGAAFVYVHGVSGTGKSTLVEQFLDEVRTGEAAVVLEGRCYERESVPYKALDSLVDAFTQRLTKLPRTVVDALVPDDVSALKRLFPVLERVESFAAAGRNAVTIADPHELRLRAFGAFRELLRGIARQEPLVLFIDDCQWGDVDSATLLAGLIRSPDPPPVMWIACYRTDDAQASPFLQRLMTTQSVPPAEVYTAELVVADLPREEAREMALHLLPEQYRGDTRAEAMAAEAMAREAGGNPFFIYELVRSISETTVGDSATGSSLKDIIGRRVSRLSGAARIFLELVAVAGQPIPVEVVKRAANLQCEEESVVGILRAAGLVRTRSPEGRNEIETYHDRTRETISQSLGPEVLCARHGALASELEASGRGDPEMLLTHFQGAGERAKAAQYAVVAGERASAALAFDQAARLYRNALELGLDASAEAHRLREKLGDSLTNAGRGGEAASAYLGAAAGMAGLEKLELERRAAAQLLLSGRIDEGLSVARSVLDALGVKIAKTPHRSFLRFLFWRARIALSGFEYHGRGASPIPAEDRIRIDACWSLFEGLTMVDTFWAHEFHARNLLYSLSSGDLYRIARAMVSEAGVYAVRGGRYGKRAAALLERATSLAEKSGHPHAAGLASLQAGVCAFTQGHWADCRRRMELAEASLRERCTGVAWELATSHMMGSVSLFFLGEVKLLCERLPVLLAEAQARDDLYQGTDLRSRLSHVVHLAADQPEMASRELDEALKCWPREHYHLQHWWALIARLEAGFYCGHGRTAWAEISQAWGRLRSSFLLQIQYVSILSRHHRARAALAFAGERGSPIPDREGLLAAAGRDAAVIEREKMPWGNGLALLVRAGVASLRGNRKEAVRLFTAAETILESADMSLYSAAARRRRGELLSGEEGRTLIAEADARMLRQQIRNPARMAAVFAPAVTPPSPG
jgi:eukaryotic-like serine/threonine-protein kinase